MKDRKRKGKGKRGDERRRVEWSGRRGGVSFSRLMLSKLQHEDRAIPPKPI
jgi:hypothetical protein